MTKRKRKSNKPEKAEIESAVTDAELTGAVSAELLNESTPPDPDQKEELPDRTSDEQATADKLSTPTGTEADVSPDDLLDNVRRSLIEDETDKNKNESKWWRRIGRKDKAVDPEPSLVSVEIDLPPTQEPAAIVEEQKQSLEPEEYTDQIDDLIGMLEAERQESDAETTFAAEVEIQPEPAIDFEELKEQAFRPRTSDEDAQGNSDVRSIALEGGEEVFVEVESKAADPFEERLEAIENTLRPYRSYIYMIFAFLGFVMAVIASLLIFNAYQQSRPEPVKEISNLPYPTAVSLPGGWSFQLGRGTLQGGNWEPRGAEWLEGTEVCRWVSLPWSRQLEAVVRTLNPKDPIELVMSNNDKLVYQVQSLHEMGPEEIQNLDDSSPCLLIILTQSASEKRWVLTALP